MLPAPQDVSHTNHHAEEIYGPILVGVFFSTVLYGVYRWKALQMFTYHEKSSKRDSVWTRGLVLCLFICITLTTAFNMVAVYQPLIQEFGSLHSELPFYLRPGLCISSGLISTPVQLLMAWRIMVVTGTRLWTCVIVAIAMLSFGASICTAIKVSFKPDVSQFAESRAAPITWLASSAVADLIITGVLVYSLHVRKSGYNTSLDTYVNHIIRVTVQTGALTAMFAFSDTLVFAALKVLSPLPSDLSLNSYFAWGLALPNLYISTILSSLNARDSWTNRENALLPTSSNDNHSQSGLKFWGSMALHNPAHIDTEIQSELNGEIGVQTCPCPTHEPMNWK
ncbi:hypothetical protein C8J56DRAFT_941260 [Mycena floridula]|nr:hypothetical protein C8J56DRAFT_941260 [Mycena floridula]